MITFGVIWAFCFGLWVLIETYAFGYEFSVLNFSLAKELPFGRTAWFIARLTFVLPFALFLTAFAYWG